jgi:hypothetical protein
LLFLGWSFYNLYVRGVRTPVTTTITWLALTFMIGFWTWHLTKDVWSTAE